MAGFEVTLYGRIWVTPKAERGHPFPLIPISYELPLGCHSRGQSRFFGQVSAVLRW